MKTHLIMLFVIAGVLTAKGQSGNAAPDLSKIKDQNVWKIQNREAEFNSDTKYVHLNAKPDDGVIWLKGYTLANGTIEVDLKGKNERGRSFVGVAFHGVDDKTYDAIYFRPFNFNDSERKNFSVQYVSLPNNSWEGLRQNFPGKYENKIDPVPNPVDGWFHASIKIEYPKVSIFINNEKKATLEIQQLSKQAKGSIGLWVGNNSEGDFKNLKITAAK